MALNPVNFFKYYAFHPDDQGLSKEDHLKALIGTIALGVLTLGIVHLICRLFFYDKTIAHIQAPTKSSELFHKTLSAEKKSLPGKMEAIPHHPTSDIRNFQQSRVSIEKGEPLEKNETREKGPAKEAEESGNPPKVFARGKTASEEPIHIPLPKETKVKNADDEIELESAFQEVKRREKAAPPLIAAKNSESLPNIPLETQNMIIAWSKLGKKITAPTQMNMARAEVMDWLSRQNDTDIMDLFKAMPDKMASLVENFPEVFAEVCAGSEIANIAMQLFQTGNDLEGKAINNILQNIFARAVVPANLDLRGNLKDKDAIYEFYALLSAFAKTPLFHPACEKQLMAMKQKIPPRFIPATKTPPQQLLKKIHHNIEEYKKAVVEKAKETLAQPVISDARKEEILKFMEGLIANPEAEYMKRRAFLTTMAKHAKRVEIPFLVQNLGGKNIDKLWVFESVVNNAANDPTLRLTQMFNALSDEQFDQSLASSAFLKVIARCPPAAVGLNLKNLKMLADSCSCDEDLSNLYHLLKQEKSSFYQKQEKMTILAEVVARVNVKVAAEAALLKAEEPPVDVEEFASTLKATMDPSEIGKTIDKLDDAQLAHFIYLLGTGVQLANFWAIEQKKVVAGSAAKLQRKRLARIFPKLSNDQIAQSATMAGFLTVVGNTDEKYIKSAGIIAKEPKMVWTLKDLIHKFPKGDKTIMAKLRAIGENALPYSSVLTKDYQSTLQLLKAAADKWHITMPEPEEGWGEFRNKKAAAKYLNDLYSSKFH
ncbi:hypothetical protein [Estrella lausannensis]|uniref:Putative membrane protein n=1 Tax=Estrella lausannensis TaxID=483423 RepID=A0A0H5E3Y8_9BACT|nr:hypothetical protein [Estrella lausannensis]CRX37930.1 putative membrane protein [Estrella lausannensis]